MNQCINPGCSIFLTQEESEQTGGFCEACFHMEDLSSGDVDAPGWSVMRESMKKKNKCYPAQIEIDERRGVIYVHLNDAQHVETVGAVTILRVSGLGTDIGPGPYDVRASEIGTSSTPRRLG